VVVAADDVGDAHVVVVDDDGQHVGGYAVRAQDDDIVEILVRETTRPWTRSSTTVSPSCGACAGE
jgi:predicted DNA-binding protein with PD1-like motif